MSTVRAEIAAAVRKAGQHESPFQAPPATVFWPDPDSAWLGVIDRLQEALPLLTLADYEAGSGKGPAIWVRAAIADPTAASVRLPAHLANQDDRNPWVIYLPGVLRDAFADLGRLAPELAPLADLQLRSRWWLQNNQQPWTPQSFLRSRDGLGLDLARDEATRAAVINSLPTLLDEEVEGLRRGPHLDAVRLNAVLIPDAVSLMLRWLDDPQPFRTGQGASSWAAFTGLCRESYGIDPERDTTLTAAHLMRRREGPWLQVWTRYAEAPQRYPHVPDLLDRAAPETLFGDDPHPDSRPAWNAEQEADLRSSLLAIPTSATQPRDAIAALEAAHGARRNTVWAQLGRTPLADALGWLHLLADATDEAVPATGLSAVTQWYVERGHRVDDHALRALAAAPSAVDRAAVRAALAALYDPWLNRVAGLFQREALRGYVGVTGLAIDPGTCVVFVDGLRFDLGERLAGLLVADGLAVDRDHRLAAFPTVTPCGQPAVAPLTVPVGAGPGMAAGNDRGRAMSGHVFRDALAASGVGYLGVGENGDPSGRAWTQTNDIDALGHAHGHKLADLLDHELVLVAERVTSLIAAGWRDVVIVTDHGFLLPASTASKVELPMHLTEGDAARKPRVARLKAGQTTTYPTQPWTWADDVTMVSAPGASAFVAGTLYEHGGLSPQECVIPVLTVGLGVTTAQDARIEGLRWTGYRCRVDVVPAAATVTVEVRHAAGDGSTRIGAPKQPVDGEAKILVSEEEASEGRPVVVVLLDADGNVIDQQSTTVGGT